MWGAVGRSRAIPTSRVWRIRAAYYSCRAAKLKLDETPIRTVRVCHQFVVRTGLDNAPILDEHHAIGAPDRAQPVRNDEEQALAPLVLKRIDERVLRFRVERGRRLVENEYRSLADQSAGDGKSLFLSDRQRCTTLAESRSEPFWK